MSRRSIDGTKARADEFADAFENYDPKPGDRDAPLLSTTAVKLAAWRRATTETQPRIALALRQPASARLVLR